MGPSDRASIADARFARGSRVWVERRGRWWPAIVVRTTSRATYRVHYEDGLVTPDEDLPAARVAAWQHEPPGPRGSDLGECALAIAALVLLVLMVAVVTLVREVESAPGAGGDAPVPESAGD